MSISFTAGQGLGLGSILKGYGPVTFLVVGNLAFSGLLVSWVMKFADSIMKVRLPPDSIMSLDTTHIPW